MIATLVASTLWASTALALPPQDPSTGARRQGSAGTVGALVLGAADRDADGALTAAEWDAFVDSLGGDADGVLDRATTKARLLLPALDRDGDRKVTGAELAAAMLALDQDGDGVVRADERTGGGRGGTRAFVTGMLTQLADADRNGEVTEAERRALAATDAEVEPATFAGWVTTIEADVPEDRRAFTPSVFLLTLDSWLDADTDGKLTRADFAAIRAALDADGDGNLSATELAPPRRRAGQGAGDAARAGGWGTPITAEDRRRPPLMPWQRNLDDALAMQRLTGKPLLIAVNADGEPASESLAWKRYRDPEFAQWAAGFVCVITSPDRREARDHDDRGQRLVDERFGRIVNEEALAIEPELFERYFDGRRVAPRHIGVAPDGTVLFDLAMVNDLRLIDRALQEYGVPEPPIPAAKSLSEDQLLDSPDAGHRARLEQLFVDGDDATRLRLVRAALEPARATGHPELVRLALQDGSPAVRSAGVDVLAGRGTPQMIDLFRPAFRAAIDDPGATAQLIDALERIALGDNLGQLRARAATWRDLQVGLCLKSALIDVGHWRTALAFAGDPEPAPTPAERDDLDTALAELERARRADPKPAIDVEIARLTLRYALATLAAGDDPRLLLEDARHVAERAIASVPENARAHAYAAQASHLLNDAAGALHHGMHAVAHLLPQASSRAAAETLALYAHHRVQEIYAAIADNRSFPSTWVADVNAAYSVLLEHPAATEAALGAWLDWLDQVGGWGIEGKAAPRVVARFPGSAAMHERWRGQLLRDGGARALEAAYDDPAPAAADAATWQWFRGLAKLVAAERHVQDRRPEAALAAYARAVETFDAAIAANAGYADSATHYQALALAGMARHMAARGELDAAERLARAALDKRPASADSADGLGATPRATARGIADQLEAAGRDEEAAALRARAD